MTLESNQAVEFPFYISTRLIIRDSPTGLFFEAVFDRIYYLVNIMKKEKTVKTLIIVAIDHLLESA